VADVDKLAFKCKMFKGQTYHNISLGQGQDVVAMEKLENAHRQGHWVILNNVHLMPKWLKTLQKRLDEFAQTEPHENFRVLLSSGICV
jgi:dynein heavy chain, axonemal